MLRETTKKGKEKKRIKSPRATSQTVPASDWMLNVKLHGSKIRKDWKEGGAPSVAIVQSPDLDPNEMLW